MSNFNGPYDTNFTEIKRYLYRLLFNIILYIINKFDEIKLN